MNLLREDLSQSNENDGEGQIVIIDGKPNILKPNGEVKPLLA